MNPLPAKFAAEKIKILSHVYWSKKNKLHAEGIAPIKRRTIADGKHLFQYNEDDPKGFLRPISELSEQMQASLQLVPGTAMDHLLRIKGKEETLIPATDEANKRVGIQTDNNYVVLLFDDTDRLISVDFFKTATTELKYANYNYFNFSEIIDGAVLGHRA